MLKFFELFVEFSESTVKNITFIDAYVYQPQKINERSNIIIEKKGEVEKAFWKLSLYELTDEKIVEQVKTVYLEQWEYYQLTVDFYGRLKIIHFLLVKLN